MSLRLLVCGFWRRNLCTLTVAARNEKKNRKAEKNTRVKAKTCKTKEGVGRSGAEKRKVGEREKSTKKWRGEEEKETVISHTYPMCASLCTGRFDNVLSSNEPNFKRLFLLS